MCMCLVRIVASSLDKGTIRQKDKIIIQIQKIIIKHAAPKADSRPNGRAARDGRAIVEAQGGKNQVN